MGLDMYLHKKTYVERWDHHAPENKFEVTVTRGGKPFTPIKNERISYVIEKVAYWRKANHIHKWFVDNCQGGKDECQEQYVEASQLQALVDLCKKVMSVAKVADGPVVVGQTLTNDGWEDDHEPGQVITNPEDVAALLPTQKGFFFGVTDYDGYYLDDVKYTIETLEAELADEGNRGDYYYRSSW